MPKYLFEGKYSLEGAKGLAREGGSGRRQAIAAMCEGLGGKLEHLYFAFGDVDVYAIADLPNEQAAAAASLAVNQNGSAAVKVVVLMTPEQLDAAAKKSVNYRAAGR